jgi:transcriptional antiterminator RfaH
VTWLVVHTRPRQEEEARTNLAQQGFQTFLPCIRERKRRGRRLKWVISPLFPRYLFVDADLGEQDLAVIRSTRGAVDLVRFGSVLVPVPDVVIDHLRALQHPEAGAVVAPDEPYRPGDRVEILEGPFAGLSGVFDVYHDADRVALLLEVLGRQARVSLQREQVGEVLDRG